jgi:hypothetical protein
MSSDKYVVELLIGIADEFGARSGVPPCDLGAKAQVFLDVLEDRGFDLAQLEHLHRHTDIPYRFLGRALVKQAVYNVKQTFADCNTSRNAWHFNGVPQLKSFAEW